MMPEQTNPFLWRTFVQPFAVVPVRSFGQVSPGAYKVVPQSADAPIEKAPEFLTSEKTRARQRAYKAKFTAKSMALRVNANSNIGYSDQAGNDRNKKIRGRA